ncbi:hypothetical protein M0802_011555 [Mischocyttarus mexicanus]|nr:hypothetical protein M0802_011555 [Mischocyttarus mexicanus]
MSGLRYKCLDFPIRNNVKVSVELTACNAVVDAVLVHRHRNRHPKSRILIVQSSLKTEKPTMVEGSTDPIALMQFERHITDVQKSSKRLYDTGWPSSSTQSS